MTKQNKLEKSVEYTEQELVEKGYKLANMIVGELHICMPENPHHPDNRHRYLLKRQGEKYSIWLEYHI